MLIETDEIHKKRCSGLLGDAHRFQVLHFVLQGRSFCIDLGVVDRILPIVALTQIPGAPPWIKGLLNLGGESIPVVDLRRRLELDEQQQYHLNALILLCGGDEKKVGLIVHEVLGIRVLDRQALEQEELLKKASLPFLGVVSRDGHQALLLDLAQMLEEDFFSNPNGPAPQLDQPARAGKG